MSNQVNDSSHITFNNILELYQKCRRSGDWAKVYLETRGTEQFFTISVNVSAGFSTGTTSGVEIRKKKKKPGQVRRDQQRRTAFLERRRQAATVAEEAGTDEIREEEVEKSGDVEIGAGETGSSVGVETGQASGVGSGVSQTSHDVTQSKDTQDNVNEMDTIMQLDGNMSLSEIEAEEQENEKPRRISLWMNEIEISIAEVRETFSEHGIVELDCFGSFTTKNELTDEIVKVFQLRMNKFNKTKLDRVVKNWEKACRWCYCTFMWRFFLQFVLFPSNLKS